MINHNQDKNLSSFNWRECIDMVSYDDDPLEFIIAMEKTSKSPPKDLDEDVICKPTPEPVM